MYLCTWNLNEKLEGNKEHVLNDHVKTVRTKIDVKNIEIIYNELHNPISRIRVSSS